MKIRKYSGIVVCFCFFCFNLDFILKKIKVRNLYANNFSNSKTQKSH